MNVSDYFAELNSNSKNVAANVVLDWRNFEFPKTDFWGQLHNRAALKLLNVEKAATLLIGEIVGLTVDKEIFPGVAPYPACNVATLRILGETPAEEPSLRIFNMEFTAIDFARPALMAVSGQLAARLPLPCFVSITSNITEKISITSLKLTSPIIFSRSGSAGKTAFSANTSLELQVATF